MGRLSSRFSLARDSWDRHSTGTCSSLAMIFSIRLMSDDRLLAVFAAVALAPGGGHQLQIVDDHQAQIVQTAALGVHIRHRQQGVVVDADVQPAEGRRALGNA